MFPFLPMPYFEKFFLIVWGFWVAVKADPSETPVSCAKRLNDFRGLICSRASISRTFSSVSTILFDCFFMSQTEPLARHFFTSLESHDFVGTGESGYLRQNLRMHFLKFFLSFNNKHTLFNSELHLSINFDRPSTPLTMTDY
jgi:hypothetical protein